jgi:uncharacterized membrane protein
MLGLARSVRWYAGEVRWFVDIRGFLFAWNLFLALVPLALAWVLFRPGIRRGAAWWAGVVAFFLFLPNSAYVLTDVVHLMRDVRATDSDLALITLYLPAYGVFFAVGLSAYALSLMRLQSYLRVEAPRLPWLPLELCIHAAVAVGIFLGRVKRLNSWEVFTSPSEVTDTLPALATRFPLLFIAFTFVVLVVLTALARPTLRAAMSSGTGLVRRTARLVARGLKPS